MSGLSHKRRGFTLVELLVVIGIIALLISILLPTLARARDAAKSIKCASNARQLAQGLLGYTTDFQGQFPVGFTPIGFPSPFTAIVGIPTLPVAQRSMEGWTYAVSGYLNPARMNGYSMPWLAVNVTLHDPNDNYHPVLYCPQVLQDFDNMWTHYGPNTTIMPDWWSANYIGTFFGLGNDLYAPSHPPMNTAQLYADNFLLWDGQLQRFATSTVTRINGVGLAPSQAFNGIDFSQITIWAYGFEDWDLKYRNDEGEDATLTGDPWRSAEFPAMIVAATTPGTGLSLGEYWYGPGWAYLRGQEDLLIQPGPTGTVWETDLQLTQIMRHNGKARCNTAFVDGSVRGMSYNPKENHPALPGGPYVVGELRRQHLRPKWPNPLPRPQ